MVNIHKTFVHRVLIGLSVFGLAACSSVHKDTTHLNESDEMEDISQTNSAEYLCNNTLLTVLFHAENAQVSWKDKNYHLTHAISASGAFYLGEGLSFWIHGDEAEIEQGVVKTQCHLVRVDS